MKDTLVSESLKQWEDYLRERVLDVVHHHDDADRELERLTTLAKNIGVLGDDGVIASDFAGEAQRDKRAALLEVMRELAEMNASRHTS